MSISIYKKVGDELQETVQKTKTYTLAQLTQQLDQVNRMIELRKKIHADLIAKLQAEKAALEEKIAVVTKPGDVEPEPKAPVTEPNS